MLPMLTKTNHKKKQKIKIAQETEVQKENKKDFSLKEEIRQEKWENYPVENASKIHTQIFLGVQTSRSIYQENQIDQTAYPRKYGGCA